MKTIAVPARSRALNQILKEAASETVVLEASDGQRFALTRIDDWEAFDVGSGRSFAEEVKRTGKNKGLLKALASRRKSAKSAAIPLAEVRRRLGLK